MSTTIPSPLKHALRIAATSSFYPYKLGATIARKNGKILSRGVNGLRHHSRSHMYNYAHTCHAETAAILRTHPDSLRGATLYVARVNKQGNHRLAKPCDCCLTLARMVGIKKIIYTTNEGYNEEVLRNN